jgi:hypothetical protein
MKKLLPDVLNKIQTKIVSGYLFSFLWWKIVLLKMISLKKSNLTKTLHFGFKESDTYKNQNLNSFCVVSKETLQAITF